MSKKTLMLLLGMGLLASAVVLCGYAIAQDQGTRPGGAAGQPPADDMNARMEQARTRMLDRAREQLGFTEQEWAQVRPRYEAVSDLNRQLSAGGMRGGMGRGAGGGPGGPAGPGGPGGPGGRGAPESGTTGMGGNRPGPGTGPGMAQLEDQTELGKARTQLRDALADEQASADQIKAALDGYRVARAKAERQLEESRKALRELLNIRQEATLVSQGLLN